MKRVVTTFFYIFHICMVYSGNDMEQIMGKIRHNAVYVPSDSIITNIIDNMDENGSFRDIDYSVTSKVNWEPKIHYNRLLMMSYSYISPASLYYSNEELYQKIVNGIDFWVSSNPQASNWYHTQVDESLNFGLILIAMRGGKQKLPQFLEDKVVERWRNNGSNPAKRTGSNRAEIALHYLYFACLIEDEELLESAIYYAFEPVAFTDSEGIQVDYSFFQHGKQFYIGGYGENMLESVLEIAVCVIGTKYMMSEEKLILLRQYVLSTYSDVLRGQTIRWSCFGRSISRPNSLKDPERRLSIINKMIELDKVYERDYQKIKNRLLGISKPGEDIDSHHNHYFRGDYTVHVRPKYSFSTRMVSNRTCKQEHGNGENLQNYYLSDGATEVLCTGEEFVNLMPLWDWNKIPGVTAPILDTIPKAPELWSVYGTSEFAGGVSDSIYGCTAYKFYDDYSGVNTGASKGWFFFDDEVVCLGAGISSDHENVQTTINQCWGERAFNIGFSDGTIRSYEGNVNQTHYAGNVNWVLHDGIGYYFPVSQQVMVENKKKVGNWRWISEVQEDKELEGKVFTIGTQHKMPSENEKYSYIVIPNSTEASLANYRINNEVEVLANTDSVQVVHHSGKKMYQCIFYRPCKFTGENVTINSFQPCAVIFKDFGDSYVVHIADPSQSRMEMTVGIRDAEMGNLVYGSCDFTGIDSQFAGMTKVMRINKTSTAIQDVVSEPIVSLSADCRSLRFDKQYSGLFSLIRPNGMTEHRGQFCSEGIWFDECRKGLYILSLHLDGHKGIHKKIIIK